MDKKKLFIPRYALIPAVIYIITISIYYIGRGLTENSPHYSVDIFLDQLLPFVPSFVFIYVLAYLQWFAGYVIIANSYKDICYKYFGGDLVAKIISLIIFLVFPTVMVRPEIMGDGAAEGILAWIYRVDEANMLFPSIHCLESWIVMRGTLESGAPKWVKTLMLIFSLLVMLSVVLVKQHVVLDIPGGIIVGELGILLFNKFNGRRVYEWLENRIGW